MKRPEAKNSLTKQVYLVALLAACGVSLSACRYNFVPVILPEPAGLSLTLPVSITQASLLHQGEYLVLTGKIKAPHAGYLSVVWYRQDTELGRDSVYIAAASAAQPIEFRWAVGGAKDAVNYRAMLLFEGQLLRQVDEQP